MKVVAVILTIAAVLTTILVLYQFGKRMKKFRGRFLTLLFISRTYQLYTQQEYQFFFYILVNALKSLYAIVIIIWWPGC